MFLLTESEVKYINKKFKNNEASTVATHGRPKKVNFDLSNTFDA